MKHLLGTLVLFLSSSMAFSQQSKIIFTGEIINEQSLPVPFATISINNITSTANEMGKFSLSIDKKNSVLIKVACTGYNNYENSFVITNKKTNVQIVLKSKAHFLLPLEVQAIRAANNAPFTKTNLTKQQIALQNLGQDLPFILNQTPSTIVNSDAGNGIGYTGIKIRGTDATRINVTLNGIPYNDAESQGTFFVDLPDFASSSNSIQIQRGVGTSSNGTGAFGATINVSTNEFIDKPTAELNNSFGSFNSWKNSFKVSSGLINNAFTVDARLSQISSNGYIDRASAALQSFYLSTAFTKKKLAVRLNIFSGKEKTYQAWNGVDEATLKTNRTYNISGTEKSGSTYDNETDNYTQTHYQLFFNSTLNNYCTLSVASFLTRGLGYYENYKAQQKFSKYGLPNYVVGATTITKTDLVRQQWLDNYFYGQNISLQYKKLKNSITFGAGWNKYIGDHIGKIIWAAVGVPNNHIYYNVPANKTDISVYTKWQYTITPNALFFVDVQHKNVQYTMNGFKANPTLKISRKFSFLNPKIGFTYTKNGWQSYLSYALANKEPNREDFEVGTTNQPLHETLHDFELGTEKTTNKFYFAATAYYMLYKNQLVLTGKINDVGAYTRTNVANSFRAGIELQANYTFTKWLNVAANLTLSTNKIKQFTQYMDNYDAGGQITIQHQNTDIALSPNTIAFASINFNATKQLQIALQNKFVSKQYLDNTSSNTKSLNGYSIQDVRCSYNIQSKLLKQATIIAQANNILNTLYQPNGYTFSYLYLTKVTTENYYFPMAGTNFMLALNIKL